MIKINKEQEIRLLKEVSRGNTSALEPLINKYKKVSISLSFSILNNHDDAEDAVQEAFIRVFRAAKKFNYKSSFSTWLYKIVVNQSRTKLSKVIKQNEKYKQSQAHDSYQSSNITHNNTSDLADKKLIINNILAKLKDDYSLLLRLYYLAERDTSEIASITGFSSSKIKTSLHRARKEFEELAVKYYPEEIKVLL